SVGFAVARSGPQVDAVSVTRCGWAAAKFWGEVVPRRVGDEGVGVVSVNEAVADGPGWPAGEGAGHDGSGVRSGGKSVAMGLGRGRFIGAEQQRADGDRFSTGGEEASHGSRSVDAAGGDQRQ